MLNEGLYRLAVNTYDIDDETFECSDLEEIVLPSTLKEISGPVFRDYVNLRIV